MSETKTLVLEFVDEDNNTKSVVIKNPKDDLTKEAVTEAMNTIIEEDALLTNAARHLTDIKNCYYRTVTIDELPFADVGE